MFFQGVPGGWFRQSSKCERLPLPVNVNSIEEMSEKGLPGGPWMKVPGKFNMQGPWRRVPGMSKKQAHCSGTVLVYVCVLNGHSSFVDHNATTLRNQGICQRKVFQGVTG